MDLITAAKSGKPAAPLPMENNGEAAPAMTASVDVNRVDGTAEGQDEAEEQERPMPEAALVFLNDPLAQRLAVAWQTCDGDEGEWLLTAGLAHDMAGAAYRMSVALRRNGICRRGGVVDKLALQYIAAMVVKPLQQRRQAAQGGGKRGK